jgi:hypothetical protein
MPRRRALDQRVHRLVGVGTAQSVAAIPRMIGIGDAALRFFARAGAGALGPGDARGFKIGPMPASAVVQLYVALPLRGAPAKLGELVHERQLAIVLLHDGARFRL